MAISNWTALQARLDAIIDVWWAEPVQMFPWTGGTYTNEGNPDPARQVVVTRAVFMQPDPATLRLAMAFGGGGAGFQQVETTFWMSVQDANIGDLASWKAYDRIYFPQRNEWFVVLAPVPSATNRPNVYLTRLQGGAPPNLPPVPGDD